MPTTPRLLDVVALLSDVAAHGLLRGQVGTVVELLDGAYEVEFSDDDGKTYAELALAPDRHFSGEIPLRSESTSRHSDLTFSVRQ